MIETIFIVFGKTGEYSNRREWPVVAFRNEDNAKKLVSDCEQRAKEIFVTSFHEYSIDKGVRNELDPQMEMDYTGTSYYYLTVELQP